MDESADAAMQQIHQKQYAEKYRLTGKTLTGIGINFGSNKKAVSNWKMEVL